MEFGSQECRKASCFPYPQVIEFDWRTSTVVWDIPSESEILVEYLEREGWGTLDDIEGMLLGFDVKALVFAGAEALGLAKPDNPGSQLFIRSPSPKIRLHSVGAFNQLYLLTFPALAASATGQRSHLQILARLPKLDRSLISASKVESVVATMTFSRHCRGLPVPQVFSWNPYHDAARNSVLCPYILMEFVTGISLESHWTQLCSQPSTSEREKMKEAVLDVSTRLHVRLCEPLPFFLDNEPMLGSLYFDWTRIDQRSLDLSNSRTYRVGALAHGYSALKKRRHDALKLNPIGPTDDLRRLWKMCLRNELEMVCTVGTSLFGKNSCLCCSNDELEGKKDRKSLSPELVNKIGDTLEKWTDGFFLPSRGFESNDSTPSFLSSCFVMDDWAFRNVIVDPFTGSLCAIVDWDDVYILPFILSGHYPEDLCPTYDDSAVAEGSRHFDQWNFLPQDENRLVMPFPLPNMLRESETALQMESHEHVLDWVQLDERIECTIWRRVYREKLAALDPRFGSQITIQGARGSRHLEGFWEIRQDPMKIQRLLLYGWKEWVRYGWLIEGRTGPETSQPAS